MKFDTAPAFVRDLKRLTPEHRQLFRDAVHHHFLPAVAAGSFTGQPPWPPRLRIHQLDGSSIYSLTWSFAGPDGRATFHLEKDDSGEPLLVWRRIGNHAIDDRP